MELLFCINFMLKKPVWVSQNLQHKFLDWKWPPFPFGKISSDLAQPSFPQVCNLKRDWNYAWDPSLMARFKRLSCSFFPLSRNILCTTWFSSIGGVVEYQWSNFFHSPVQTWAKCSSSKFEGRFLEMKKIRMGRGGNLVGGRKKSCPLCDTNPGAGEQVCPVRGLTTSKKP